MTREKALGWVGAILAAIFSAGYWWLALNIAYGLIGGDRAPWLPQPSIWETRAKLLAVIIIAVVLFGLLTIAWRRVWSRFD